MRYSSEIFNFAVTKAIKLGDFSKCNFAEQLSAWKTFCQRKLEIASHDQIKNGIWQYILIACPVFNTT